MTDQNVEVAGQPIADAAPSSTEPVQEADGAVSGGERGWGIADPLRRACGKCDGGVWICRNCFRRIYDC